MTLHILSASPFAGSCLAQCRGVIAADDALLLTGDGVYAALGDAAAVLHELRAAGVAIFALAEDCAARASTRACPTASPRSTTAASSISWSRTRAPCPGSEMGANAPLPPRDADGFLLHRADWNEQVATALAREEGLTLTPAHREILHMLQAYYREHEHAPAMRALVSLTRRTLGPTRAAASTCSGCSPAARARGGEDRGPAPPEHCL